MLWYTVSLNQFEGEKYRPCKKHKIWVGKKMQPFCCSPLSALSNSSPTWAVIQPELMGIIMTAVELALELMSNYWLHLGYFCAYWLILDLGERVWLSYCLLLGWKCPPRCPHERASCGFRVASSVPRRCSHRHLSLPKGICPSGWRTRSRNTLPWRSRWAEVRLGHLLCWSPCGFSLIYTGVVDGISGIPVGHSLVGSVGTMALPPLFPPALPYAV